MDCKDCHISIKVLKDLPGHRIGQVIKVQSAGGIPVLKFWRDRLRDSKIDGCIEVVKTKKPIKKTEGDK